MTALYTITLGPREFPRMAVVRRHVYAPGVEAFIADAHPIAVVDSVDDARRFLPAGVTRFETAAGGEANSVEFWG